MNKTRTAVPFNSEALADPLIRPCFVAEYVPLSYAPHYNREKDAVLRMESTSRAKRGLIETKVSMRA
jgi:hypothetical protein